MKINVNGITLNYAKVGQGKPLILLHGNGENHHIFDKLIERLKVDFTIYAIDSRNHGESSKTDAYDYKTMSADVRLFIQSLNIKNPSFLGFSDGAIIGLLLALEYKNIFSRMALLGVNLKPSDFKGDIYNEIVNDYKQTKDPLLKMMLEQPNIELDSLKDIHTPTLIIAGEKDVFKESLYTNIQNTLPVSQLKIMYGHDHSSYIVDQDILASDIKSFLT